jgi:hypothetical protein
MTENNQCFLDVDIHMMFCNMLCHYISFLNHKHGKSSYLLPIDLSQPDCVSLKPKDFHTGELCEPVETGELCEPAETGELCEPAETGELCEPTETGEMCEPTETGEMDGRN